MLCLHLTREEAEGSRSRSGFLFPGLTLGAGFRRGGVLLEPFGVGVGVLRAEEDDERGVVHPQDQDDDRRSRAEGGGRRRAPEIKTDRHLPTTKRIEVATAPTHTSRQGILASGRMR
jgi:hypothetical protein